jgi:serine/threonine-protein kinase
MAAGGAETEAFPRSLGRYALTGILGQGAMGVVYRAHDPVIDRPVAIKVVRADLLDPEGRQDFLDRFRVEARSAGRCTHQNIVAVYDYSDDAVAPYIVMEFVEGETLQQRLRRQPPLSPADSVGIVTQMLDALGYAHERAIVHRDVKPANVVVLGQGRVKLMDFGVAHMGGTHLTQVGAMIGTLRYMAPEQAAGAEIDHRADLYSAAVVLFEMLTGQALFPGGNASQLLLALTGPAPADLGALSGGLAGFAPVLARALAKDPAARFGSAAAFAAALRGVAPGTAEDGDATVVQAAPHRPAGFDGALLQSLEKDLATYVGPISKLLVQQEAAGSSDAEELYTRVAQRIPQGEGRDRFLSAVRISSETVAGTIAKPAAGLSDAAVAAAQALLTSYIGPIAKLVTRDAALKSATAEAFCDTLSTHLPRPDERAKFRQRFKAEVEPKL